MRLLTSILLSLGSTVAHGEPAQLGPIAGVMPLWVDMTAVVSGPPPWSCADLKAQALSEKAQRKGGIEVAGPAPMGVVPTADRALVKPVSVPSPTVDWKQVKAGKVPDPAAMPVGLQPFEGGYLTLKKVGDVLRAAEAGRPVRVTFYGASHTGGDFLTGELRRRLQARYGDRGHGYVMPAPLYQGYRAHDINLCASDGWRSDWVGRRGGRGDGLYGLGGASVSSADHTDFGYIQTTETNPQGRAWDQVNIHALGFPGAGSLQLQVDDADPVVLPLHRDSVAPVHLSVQLADGPHRLTFRPVGDGEVRIFGVSPERSGKGVIVDAIGVRGRTARTWLDWDPTVWQPGLAALAPDMVVLAYGTNEAADLDYAMETYRDDLRLVLARMREVLPDAACVLLGPSDRGVVVKKGQRYKIWGRTAPVAMVQREVAPEFDCVFWDWQLAQGGPGGMLAWRAMDPPLAGWDLIHFTQRGYTRSAELFIDAWLDAAMMTGGGVPDAYPPLMEVP